MRVLNISRVAYQRLKRMADGNREWVDTGILKSDGTVDVPVDDSIYRRIMTLCEERGKTVEETINMMAKVVGRL